MKLNCDASFFPNLNSAGFACVVRDSFSNWVIGSAGTILETSVLRCELFAMWRGLLLALQKLRPLPADFVADVTGGFSRGITGGNRANFITGKCYRRISKYAAKSAGKSRRQNMKNNRECYRWNFRGKFSPLLHPAVAHVPPSKLLSSRRSPFRRGDLAQSPAPISCLFSPPTRLRVHLREVFGVGVPIYSRPPREGEVGCVTGYARISHQVYNKVDDYHKFRDGEVGCVTGYALLVDD
ncbi:hypothetical protein PIB30_038601 [Stylosanthes scabra]|uniref:RNase H type-1 domain-containing protein n=1 Tax=Stylosanthes scabra TaxID=79078 RepID=A0ABU6RE39_9FABA|nr:hypothetical protein [Stylosanthes scabra]